jgi:hypothetical protein
VTVAARDSITDVRVFGVKLAASLLAEDMTLEKNGRPAIRNAAAAADFDRYDSQQRSPDRTLSRQRRTLRHAGGATVHEMREIGLAHYPWQAVFML